MQQYSRAPRWRRAITLISLTAVGLLAGAGVASAHVTVNPSEAAAGGFTKLTFRVPNESPTAGTVAVTVDLPADHPFAYVSVKQVPGWSVVPTTSTLPAPVTEGDLTIKEAVTSVTWTADPGTHDRARRVRRVRHLRRAGPGYRDAGVPGHPDLQRRRGGAVERTDPRVRRGTGAPGAHPDRGSGGRVRARRPTDRGRGQHPGDRAVRVGRRGYHRPAVPIPPQRFSRRSAWCSQQRHCWSPRWHCGGGPPATGRDDDDRTRRRGGSARPDAAGRGQVRRPPGGLPRGGCRPRRAGRRAQRADRQRPRRRVRCCSSRRP